MPADHASLGQGVQRPHWLAVAGHPVASLAPTPTAKTLLTACVDGPSHLSEPAIPLDSLRYPREAWSETLSSNEAIRRLPVRSNEILAGCYQIATTMKN